MNVCYSFQNFNLICFLTSWFRFNVIFLVINFVALILITSNALLFGITITIYNVLE